MQQVETAEAKLETDRVTEEKRLLQEELNGVKKVSHQFLRRQLFDLLVPGSADQGGMVPTEKLM